MNQPRDHAYEAVIYTNNWRMDAEQVLRKFGGRPNLYFSVQMRGETFTNITQMLQKGALTIIYTNTIKVSPKS